LDYDPQWFMNQIDSSLDEILFILERKRYGDIEHIITDLQSLSRAEFMKKYGVTEGEYEELISILEETVSEGGSVEEVEDRMMAFILPLALGVGYLAWDYQKTHTLEWWMLNGVRYVNWVTVGDELVCSVCHEYEDRSPWPIMECPHTPHPNCRCSVEPCDEHGNPIGEEVEVEGHGI